ncbi:hypothetical protein BSQ39_12975 [Loigolactobacillus backii]|uniref:hypothetical protein n=1 Tax=Loigolactobacillus backii TaxID=375175 RepID=UPI000C1C914F|nr:hypothetical protein [Loigolactobacillus backii]PIO79997.1 hypothetical protein BSQ39_12975 [Loigolactobacillus backii]
MILIIGQSPYSEKSGQRFFIKNSDKYDPTEPVAFITKTFPDGRSKSLKNMLLTWNISIDDFKNGNYPSNLMEFFNENRVYLYNALDTNGKINVKIVDMLKKQQSEKISCVIFGVEAQKIAGPLSDLKNIELYFAPHPSGRNKSVFDNWLIGGLTRFTSKNVLIKAIQLKK